MGEEKLVELNVDGAFATITLNRPKQLNALNQAVIEQLNAVLDDILQEKRVRVVLLRGEGRAFAAGADIAEMAGLDSVIALEFARRGQAVLNKLERLPVPTIALIQGFALGGGMELAMACDLRIAAEGTRFGQPEVTLGVIPGFGGSQRLPRIVGQGNALKLLLGGGMIDAAEAYRIGLVNEVVPTDDLLEAGRRLAEQLAALAPLALAWVKQAVYDGAETDLERGLALEASLFANAFATEDQKRGMRAFLEKTKTTFEGK
ncbi:crotonase [Alicyclobacillus contaminans]|uniref:enoyl-CoA hydratase/isomerase family protein n=1 Tax=Alicyclobacillus contaminans TaxID=392016 RepID=UPI0004279378|nr:enoyl-CoA hydratase-related protein [Alicyclobacillus contaminans]GMA50879.1 crotonase [Alicyclobacillus contaminans]